MMSPVAYITWPFSSYITSWSISRIQVVSLYILAPTIGNPELAYHIIWFNIEDEMKKKRWVKVQLMIHLH